MECFVIIVNGLQLLTIITKRSILDVAVALDPPLYSAIKGTLCSLIFKKNKVEETGHYISKLQLLLKKL